MRELHFPPLSCYILITACKILFNSADSYCNATVLDGVVWPSTNRNKTRTHPCPYRTGKLFTNLTHILIYNIIIDQLENRTRTCGNDGNWEDVNDTICPSRKVVQLWESVSKEIIS